MSTRIAKIETPNPYDPIGIKTTYYVRDAQGTHLVTYDHFNLHNYPYPPGMR